MENIIEGQADNMILKYNVAKSIKFPDPKIIPIKDILSYIDKNRVEDDFNIETSNFIYIISSDNFNLTREDVKQRIQEQKSERKTYHSSHINNEMYWKIRENGCFKDEYIIYVGSTENNIKNRIKQLLGVNRGRSVYSLYLKDWWPQKTNLKIRVWSLNTEIKHTNKYEILQITEDLIWDELKPLFGKKGATFNRNP